MADIAKFYVQRSPDLRLSVAPPAKGWTLLLTGQSGVATTSSPAGHFLTPKQVAAIPPLNKLKPEAAPKITSVFDRLYEALHQAYAAKNIHGIDTISQQFLVENPTRAVGSGPEIQQAVQKFFTFKRSGTTPTELCAFFAALPRKDVADYLGEASFRRIDIAKGRALALAVRRDLGAPGHDAIGLLRAELGFSVLAACLGETTGDRSKSFASMKFVDLVLGMRFFLPGWVFDIDVCDWVRQGPLAHVPAPSRLTQKLAKLQKFDAAQAAHSAAAAIPVIRTQDGVKKLGSTKTDEACVCDCAEAPCLPTDPCCAEINYYVADLLVMREETTCYKASDLAYIENIASGETRVRTHELTVSVEDYEEEEKTVTRKEERDHNVTDRFTLKDTIDQKLNDKKDLSASLKGKIYGQEYEVKASVSLTKDDARSQVREMFREVVDTAKQTIESVVRSKRSRKSTTETKENNAHTFTNETTKPMVAKYFWVSQEKKAQVLSHGLRTMVELFAPSPARLYEHLEKLKAARGFTREKPEVHVKLTLKPDDITPNNYEALASTFGVTEYDGPPAQPPVLYASARVDRNSPSAPVTIPAGYTATLIERTDSILHLTFGHTNGRISLVFSTGSVSQVRNGSNTESAQINQRNSGDATLSEDHATKDSYIVARITLTPDAVSLVEWQNEIYAQIVAKDKESEHAAALALADYEKAKAEYDREQSEKIKGRHPFAAEEIIRAELKRATIYMMCDEFTPNNAMNMNSQPCGFPEINRREASELGNEWYFFDRGFDWENASFTFYDYFRNPMCKWVDTFDPDEPNFLFKAFLRAGYARVQIPVSPGMEQDIIHYLETGERWGQTGEPPTNPLDPRWISIVEEIKHSRGCYQNDREGFVVAYEDPGSGGFDQRILMHTDRYWDVLGGVRDQDAIDLDLDREIFIDGISYRILSIAQDPAGPAYNAAPNTFMQWIVTLDRKFESGPYIDPNASTPVLKPWNYAIGAQFVGAPFFFDLPTNLVWIGDHANACLPCYPVICPQPE